MKKQKKMLKNLNCCSGSTVSLATNQNTIKPLTKNHNYHHRHLYNYNYAHANQLDDTVYDATMPDYDEYASCFNSTTIELSKSYSTTVVDETVNNPGLNYSSSTNSIHFYHPKSIQSNTKKTTTISNNLNLTCITPTIVSNLLQPLNDSIDTSNSGETISVSSNTNNQLITSSATINVSNNRPRAFPPLPPTQPPSLQQNHHLAELIKNESVQSLANRGDENTENVNIISNKNITEIFFEKKGKKVQNTVQLLNIKKTTNTLKNCNKNADQSEECSNKPKPVNNVDIYESISSSNQNFNTNIANAITNTINSVNEIISGMTGPNKSANKLIKLAKISEINKSLDSVDSIYESKLDNVTLKDSSECSAKTQIEAAKENRNCDEAEANVQETYNNNISGQEIAYVPTEQVEKARLNLVENELTHGDEAKTENILLSNATDNLKEFNLVSMDVTPVDSIANEILGEKETDIVKHKNKASSRHCSRSNSNINKSTVVDCNKKPVRSDSNLKIEKAHSNEPNSLKQLSEPVKECSSKAKKESKSSGCNHQHQHSCTKKHHHRHKKDKQANKLEDSTKMAQDLNKLITRLESVTNRLESYAQSGMQNGHAAPAGGSSKSSSESFDDLPSIAGYDEILNGTFKSFKDLSGKIGGEVKAIVDLVDNVCKYQRSFLIEAARSTQPSQDVLMKFFQQFSKTIEPIMSFREKNRTCQFFNHLSAISESIGAFGWISISPAPSPYVKEMSDSAQFYTNRVLKDYKEKDQNHVNWVKQWLQLLSELQAYVKQHHTTGVAWNSAKKSATFDPARVSSSGAVNGASASASAPAPPCGGPPPPPPPMGDLKDLLFSNDDANAARPAVSTDALFAEINKGGAITSGLKKVSDDQKTHKNPNLRAGHIVPACNSSSATSVTSKASTTSQVQKPPVFELVDKKWKVEYQQGNSNLVIDQTDLKHTIYIYQCKECTIIVKGKVNSILIDSCSRVGLLFDDVLSTVEFINSKNVQMQVLGRVPTVAIEKTDGCQVYLSKNSLATEIISSKSSAMNILIPGDVEGDFSEEPVPEQYKTVINAKTRKLLTTPTETA